MAKGKDNFIPHSLQLEGSLGWTHEMSQALRSVDELGAFLKVSPNFWMGANALEKQFPLLVTRHFASKINGTDPQDPLLIQVLPTLNERQTVPGFEADPVHDLDSVKHPGILQKYAHRVLLMPTGACAIHCRHCFRREFPYGDQQMRHLAPRLKAWLMENPEIHEVILSGGDPLLATNEQLSEIFAVLLQFPQVQRLRIHTRLPVVLPQRIDLVLLDLFKSLPMQIILVSHVNHPKELDGASAQVFKDLRAISVHLLNQSVLLRGVNHNADVLEELSYVLFSQGVLPYYLHQLDRATGTHDFEVPVSEGLAIMAELRRRLPGYLVPRYVQEVPGSLHKESLS